MSIGSPSGDYSEIRTLVRELGEARGTQPATPAEVARLRDFFAHHVLPATPDAYVIAKYGKHVESDLEWPEDTSPEEYLESLRSTVLDQRSEIYLTDESDLEEWTIYFVGRVRRAWQGPDGSGCIAVLFNGERHFFITGFQPTMSSAYVDRQGGFWLKQR
jgi:hypothetical protein